MARILGKLILVLLLVLPTTLMLAGNGKPLNLAAVIPKFWKKYQYVAQHMFVYLGVVADYV